MNREPLETYDPPSEGETLEAKLAAMERANESLREKVRHYERERADIRTRIERILARIES